MYLKEELLTRIYRELKKTNLLPPPQKINEPMKKWANKLNGRFSEEEVQMAKKHTKKCSPSLTTKEMQTLRFHFTPVRMATIKNTNKAGCQVAHACNPSYSGGTDQEDQDLKPDQENSSRDPISKTKPITKIRADGVAQGVGPEFKS
jgi:hypothetical protein